MSSVTRSRSGWHTGGASDAADNIPPAAGSSSQVHGGVVPTTPGTPHSVEAAQKLRTSPPVLDRAAKLRTSPPVADRPASRAANSRPHSTRQPQKEPQKEPPVHPEDRGVDSGTSLMIPFQCAYQLRWILLTMVALFYAAHILGLSHSHGNGAGIEIRESSGSSSSSSVEPHQSLTQNVPVSANTDHLPYSAWDVMPVREMPLPGGYAPDTAELREAWSPVIKVCGSSSSSSSSNNKEIVRVFTWSGTKSSYLRTCGLFSGSKSKEYHIYNYGVHKLNDISSTRQWMKTAEWDAAIKPYYNEPKVIVFNSGHIPASLLEVWPPNSLLLITSDEYNRFGFSHPVIKAKEGGSTIGPHVRRRTYYGPHDADMKRPHGNGWTSSGVNLTGHLDGLFVKNPEEARFGICEQQPSACGNVVEMVSRLKLSPQVTPIFKQYYSRRHAQSFPGKFHWFPLGPRFEFHRPSSFPGSEITRRLLFNFIGSPTSLARKRLAAAWDSAAANSKIPKERMKFHIAEEWAADTSQGNFAPKEYAAILQDSTFTLCPKGNNMDQFRIYEAIESGSIPVIALENGLANKTLAPNTMASPIVFIRAWDAGTFVQLAIMEKDTRGISLRRKALQEWYQTLLDNTLATIDGALSSRHAAG